ncbi:MAG TPA: prolipoprotein diacylglyceryl transferase family protein [Allosphingosinicella sp.]|jgi:prolipoprotein diacylglyceryltransferase|nr:prolipoprotein diacylglyceryl transferase family protein [Allosphingosinicella sp.]
MIHVPTDPRVHLVFDLAAWVSAGLLARLLYRWRLKEMAAEVALRIGIGYAFALAIGAIGGAWAFGSLNTGLTAIPHPSHSIAGALAGGIVAVELYKLARGLRGSTGGIWVGPLALGIAIGRWGCLFAGLPDETYGTPTSLPWGVDLGDGIPRHPVQIYESLAMLAFLGIYFAALARRAQWTRTRAFYIFVAFYAAQRFLWEFLKPYPRVLGPLDIFQLLALAMIAYAVLFDGHARRRAPS